MFSQIAALNQARSQELYAMHLQAQNLSNARQRCELKTPDRCATCAFCMPDASFMDGALWSSPPRVGFGAPIRIRQEISGSALSFAKCGRSTNGTATRYCSAAAADCEAGEWYEEAITAAPVTGPVYDITDWIVPGVVGMAGGVFTAFAFVLGSFDPMQWGWQWRAGVIGTTVGLLLLVGKALPKDAFFYISGRRTDGR